MNYISKQFNIHYLPEYNLLVKAGFQKDVLAVIDKKSVAPILIEYPSEEPILEATRIMSLPFRFVRVVIPHQSFTFIPKEVFQQDNMEQYLPFLGTSDLENTFIYSLDNLNLVALYQYDMLLVNRWRRLFPDAIILPEFAVVLDRAQERISIRGNVLGLHFVTDHLVDFYLFKNGAFQFYNNFEIHHLDDISYYILTILTQFHLGNSINKVLLSGEVPNESYYARIAAYAGDIEVLDLKTKVVLADKDVSLNLTPYHVLFDSVLCE
ncbi:DUF3822 family protein [Sphingobacterium sp. N143]|uniref:DUF3822 family protein n=1 Tax=Sphingobacterium sp. N143 TaxID=2746727 RepID=UPI00257563FD|nr:DUF3822 family protein [Sphingobacterium sp. N143]MDM1295741.1 DUF3822 family protein [Sphingobacterium sp. N143]